MTVTANTRVANSFTLSLNLGFDLNGDELDRVADVMRSISVFNHMEVQIPPRLNKVERAQMAEDFLGSFLPDSTASLLASRLKPIVEGLVVLHCPTDRHFTLLVEHS